MDPITQIFQQQSSGSAEGQGFGQFAVAGAQLNLSQQRLDLDRKQEERLRKESDVLTPLRAEMFRLQAVNAGVEAVASLQKARTIEAANEELPTIYQFHQLIANSPEGVNDPIIRRQIFERSVKIPRAYAPGTPGGDLWTMLQSGPYFRDKMQTLTEADKTLPPDRYIRSFNPKTGDIDIGLKEQTAASSTSDIKNQQFETALQSRIRSLPVGSPERIQAEEELSQFRAKTMPRGTIIRTNPDGSQEIVMGAPTGGDMTTAQEGTARIQAQRLTDTARRINEIIPMADQIFGPKAAIGTVVVDRTLANLVPGLIEGQRVEGRAKAGLVIEGLIRNLSEGQGALSNQDVKRLQAKFPELNNPEELIESPARAKIILKAIQKEVARDAYGRQRLVGSTIDAETLQFLDPTFLVEEYQRGRITKEQLSQAIESSPYVDEINDRIAKSRKGR